MIIQPALPSFSKPPVVEVALAAYFSPPLRLQSVHLGRLWQEWRDRYPRSEDQTPLPPTREEASESRTQNLAFQLNFGVPGSRVWFINEKGSHMVQIQNDRLVHNWKHVLSENEYPRYATLRPTFERELSDFSSFVTSFGLPRPVFNQAELTYVNLVPMADLGADTEFDRLLEPWTGSYSDSFLPREEHLAFETRYQILDPSSHGFLGRLYSRVPRRCRHLVT